MTTEQIILNKEDIKKFLKSINTPLSPDQRQKQEKLFKPKIMKNPTKQECEELIDKLADKTLSFGCLVKVEHDIAETPEGVEIQRLSWHDNDNFGTSCSLIDSECWSITEIIGHKVMIGDVLEMTENFRKDESWEDTDLRRDNIINLWSHHGFKKSLNEILDNAEVEEIEIECGGGKISNKQYEQMTGKKAEIFKDPNISDLFSFFIETFHS